MCQINYDDNDDGSDDDDYLSAYKTKFSTTILLSSLKVRRKTK